MTFPFAQFSPITALPPVPSVYIGRSAGAFTSGTFTWVNAPVGLGASDMLVVLEMRESNAVSSTTSMKVGTFNLTHWSGGSIQLAFINACYIDVWYGKPGAMATANIVASSAGAVGDNVFAYRLGASTSTTPKDTVTLAQASSTTAQLTDIDRVNGGNIIIGCAATFGATTFTDTWTGSETPVIDFQGVSATGNNYLCAAHIDSLATASLDDFTFNLSTTRQRIAGAQSMGP